MANIHHFACRNSRIMIKFIKIPRINQTYLFSIRARVSGLGI
jgi:hypothetical protein